MILTKEQWMKKQGFDEDGYTYCVVGNSYSIKNELKEAGFCYSPALRWHTSNDTYALPEDCSYAKVHFDEIYIWNASISSILMREGARDYLKKIFTPKPSNEPCSSNFVGEIGERLRNIECRIINVMGRDNGSGYYYSYFFIDKQGNLYVWNTQSPSIDSNPNMGLLTGTVIKHREYNNKRITQLNRCKMVFANG